MTRIKKKKSLNRILGEAILFGTLSGVTRGLIIDTTQYGASESFERAFPYILGVSVTVLYTLGSLIYQNTHKN